MYQSAIQAFSSLSDNDDNDEEGGGGGGPHLFPSLLQMEIPLTAQETTTTSNTATTTQTQYIAFLSYNPKS